MKTKIIQNIKSIILALILMLGVSYVSATGTWSNPPTSTVPPDNNTDTPLNIGYTGQLKQGNLWIKGLVSPGVTATNGLIVENGNVGIGMTTTRQKLDVNGYVKGTGMCIGASCITAWPSGTVTNIATGAGLTGGPITTTGTIVINTTGISSCTNSTTSKIYWDGTKLACGTDAGSGSGTTCLRNGKAYSPNSPAVGCFQTCQYGGASQYFFTTQQMKCMLNGTWSLEGNNPASYTTTPTECTNLYNTVCNN